MEHWLINATFNMPYLVYGAILVLACIEGPIMSMLCGVLYKMGYLSFLPLFIALVLGDLLGDSIWYFVGYYFGHPFIKRFGKYVGVTEDNVSKVTAIFHKHKEKILVISKLTNGLGLSLGVLLTAGMVKLPFGKYIFLNSIGEIIWTGVLVALGYFFGAWYAQVNTWMGRIGLGMIFILLVWLFLQWKKYFKTKVENVNLK